MEANPQPKTQFRATLRSFACQNDKCRKTFPHITGMEIQGVRTVLVDGAVFSHFRFQCPVCGGWNYHNINEKHIEEQNRMLVELLMALHGKNQDESAIIKSDKPKVELD